MASTILRSTSSTSVLGVKSGTRDAKAPNGSPAAHWQAVTRIGTKPRVAARSRHSAASRVFPTPAAPANTIAPRSAPSSVVARFSSAARPTSGQFTSGEPKPIPRSSRTVTAKSSCWLAGRSRASPAPAAGPRLIALTDPLGIDTEQVLQLEQLHEHGHAPHAVLHQPASRGDDGGRQHHKPPPPAQDPGHLQV